MSASRSITCIGVFVAMLVPSVAAADFAPIKSRADFIDAISGKNLTMLGIKVKVKPDGMIEGRAMGWSVKGSWSWSQDGFFCRQLDWGGDDIGYNCQAVSVDGNRVKFQSDRGTGQHAVLTIK